MTCPVVQLHAMADWESVHEDPLHSHFHQMFTAFLDNESCKLLNPDSIHPFCLAFKLHSNDFPSFGQILCVPPEERNKWMDSMDEELQASFDQGTLKFVPSSEAFDQGKEVTKTPWVF